VRLTSAVSSGYEKVLDCTNHGAGNLTPMQIYEWTGSGGANQRWTLEGVNKFTFSFDSTDCNPILAQDCAEYAMLAYDDFGINSYGRYYDTKIRKSSPEVLINKLTTDKFKDIISYNYGGTNNVNITDPNRVSYTFARKQIYYKGLSRTLVAVIVRGTNGVEWQGDMDVTGSSYNASLNDHYSFKQAETDLRTNSSQGLTKYLTTYNITNPVYLITGHSRGAAVANLLADTLTSSAGASNVFAYTFATPNVTKTPHARNNIFNFCFNDDFVSRVPLDEWFYYKHGITYTKTAGTLYSSSTWFKIYMDAFLSESDKKSANFNLAAVNNVISSVLYKAGNVADYYNKKYIVSSYNSPGTPPVPVLVEVSPYQYFRGYVAPAAIYGLSDAGPLVDSFLNGKEYAGIASFFVKGNVILFDEYIYDAHCPFTYYNAVKYGLFV